MQNGSETDVDCGGTCADCVDGLACTVAGNCTSGVCTSGTCATPSCSDTVQNGSETDVDCGGTCADCANGSDCTVAGDCVSGVCTSGTCATAGDICAGQLYSDNAEAQMLCPAVCSDVELVFNGNWTDDPTNVSAAGCTAGSEAVCGCSAPEIDECVTANGGCDALTTCTNTVGSRTCGDCPSGYTGDGYSGCADIDECAVNNGGCGNPDRYRCANNQGAAASCSNIDVCNDNVCSSRASYFADRYVYCRETIGESPDYCSGWMGCHGSLDINATYGTVDGTAMSSCD
jgi:hypothetical protein